MSILLVLDELGIHQAADPGLVIQDLEILRAVEHRDGHGDVADDHFGHFIRRQLHLDDVIPVLHDLLAPKNPRAIRGLQELIVNMQLLFQIVQQHYICP